MAVEIIEKLSGKSGKYWSAAHVESSGSRVDLNVSKKIDPFLFPELNLDSIGVEAVKKLIHNSGKTQHKTCGALEEMLLEYFQAAQKGLIDENALDELIDTLDEIRGYYAFGKMKVPGEIELAEIRRSIASYTGAISEEKGKQAVQDADVPDEDEFTWIRNQLLRQKELISGMNTV